MPEAEVLAAGAIDARRLRLAPSRRHAGAKRKRKNVNPMDRSNPYETAFEAFLTEQGLCYVGVDETRRAVLGDVPVKNLDFIVLGASGTRLLVDVKGRQFPGGPADKPRYVWESWATRDDVDGLTHWQSLFGADYQPLFVFMYRVMPTVTLGDTPDVWHYKNELYLFRGVTLDDYRKNMRVRSPKWGTVGLPKGTFEQIARPFRFFSHEKSRERIKRGKRWAGSS